MASQLEAKVYYDIQEIFSFLDSAVYSDIADIFLVDNSQNELVTFNINDIIASQTNPEIVLELVKLTPYADRYGNMRIKVWW